MHWRGARVRRRRVIHDAAGRLADRDGPSPRPSPRGTGGGTREGALTPALSQGDRGRDGPHPAAPLSRRRGGGREARAGFAGTPGRVATGQGAACCAPTQEGIGEGQSSGGGGAVRWTAKRRRTLARSAPDAAIRREGRRVVHRAGRRSRGWWIRWRTY